MKTSNNRSRMDTSNLRPWLLFTVFLNLNVAFGKKPNIIYILTDDMGYADVGFTNPNTPFVTPNIDGLAEEAVRLKNFYVHPTCTPTRAALMTGRYGVNVGLSTPIVPGNPGGLDPSYLTLPEQLSTMGYTNYLVGKWHLGDSKLKYHPLNRGFDHFFGITGGFVNFFTKQCGGGRYDLWRDFEPYWDNKTHATELFNQEALKVIEKHGMVPEKERDPFFMYLAYTAPHDPLLPTERMKKVCSHIENRRRQYSCALMAGIDEGVGQIRSLLSQHGMLDDTIIAFSSDNGGVPYAGALNYPFRGSKVTVYEGGVRSPGFIRAPILLPGGGREFQGLFHLVDFLPTLVSMVDTTAGPNQTAIQIPGADTLDGINQFDALRDPKSAGVRESVHIHRDPRQDSHAYRKGPWKLIVGHHSMAFMFTKVYNETTDRWIMDGGSFRGKLLESFCDVMDFIVGEENASFAFYLYWIVGDSFNIGGPQNMKKIIADMYRPLDFMVSMRPSNLEYFREKHTALYPLLSLYNIDEDPQEKTNLASHYPSLVEELLKEAEIVVSKAPSQVNTGWIHKDAPGGLQSTSWESVFRSFGTSYPYAIPFGHWLEDDLDVGSLRAGNEENRGKLIVVTVKTVSAIFAVPLLLLFMIVKCTREMWK